MPLERRIIVAKDDGLKSSAAAAAKEKRKICAHCRRPSKVCICPSLPSTPLAFHRCQVIVLQHPHESRRKNRSMPLVQLCVKGAAEDTDALSWGGKPSKKKQRFTTGSTMTCTGNSRKAAAAAAAAANEKCVDNERVTANIVPISCTSTCVSAGATDSKDFNLRTVVHRRLGDEVDQSIMEIINDPSRDVMLIFPGPDAVSLEDGLKMIENRRKKRAKKAIEQRKYPQQQQGEAESHRSNDSIVVLFLDATWKYAKEMERANTNGNWWPKDIIRVQISPEQGVNDDGKKKKSSKSDIVNAAASLTGSGAREAGVPIGFKPRRFTIRTPPSSAHLSTAECIAWVVSSIEDDPSIYDQLMKPLDLMVQRWKSFSPDTRGGGNGFLEGDGAMDGGHEKDTGKHCGKRRGKKGKGRCR